jgi:Tfp pilus assembly protein FimT
MELLVTVSLVSVLAGTAVHSASPYLYSAAGRSATQQIASDLRLTRMKAIAQNRRFQVTFNTDNGTYTIERETTLGNFETDEGPFDLPGAATIQYVSPGDPIFDTRGTVSAPTTIMAGVPGVNYHTVTIDLLGKVSAS